MADLMVKRIPENFAKDDLIDADLVLHLMSVYLITFVGFR